MLSIDQLCQDNVAKYYAAILKENAAILLIGGGFGVTGVETPDRKLVMYNVFREDKYDSMINDEFLPDLMKHFVMRKAQPNGESFQRKNIKGWHVVRTENALQGEELRSFLTALEKTLDSEFYSKPTGRIVTIRNSLEYADVYSLARKEPVSAKSVVPEKDGCGSGGGVGDVYKVFIEVKDVLRSHCQQLFDLGRKYGAISSPILTGPEFAGIKTKADYYVIGKDNADVKARATALGEALKKFDFMKSVHVQNFDKRN